MIKRFLVTALCALTASTSAFAEGEGLEVKITPSLPFVDVQTDAGVVRIERNQDTENMLGFNYGKTSRACPPFCVQPIKLATGVETVGELEVLDYLKRMSAGDESILLIDSRTPDWAERGMIPGAVNIPWSRMNPGHGDYEDIAGILDLEFGVVEEHGLRNFNGALTLVMYCNGPWCGQSPTNIRTLLSYGYPADKIKWYRGGMQSWRSLGFNVVKP